MILDANSILLIYILFINLLAFVFCAVDKNLAVKKRYRVSERSLFILCFLGGALAFFIAMRVFRHKTRKKAFYIGVPIIAVLQWIIFALYILKEIYW